MHTMPYTDAPDSSPTIVSSVAPTIEPLERTMRFAHLDAPSDELVPYGKLTVANFNGCCGWSWCAPSDQFNRKLGRTIATGRLACTRPTTRPVHVIDDRAWFWRAAVAIIDTYPQRLPAWLDDELFRDHCEVMIARFEEQEAAQ